VVDVGCRGGPPRWVHAWPGTLAGVGVDPDPAEIRRLCAEDRWPGFRWVAAWIGRPDGDEGLPEGMDRARWRAWNNRTWRRTSSDVAQRVRGMQVPPGDPGQQEAPPPWMTLDALAGEGRVDLLKVDTDGHDLEVLESGPETLSRALAVDVEVQLQGDAHPRANTFANIDALLRRAGFELFDLRLHRHSRAALPAPFLGWGGSPTHLGQTVWGDALYVRDAVATPWAPLGERGWTLAAIFELAGLPDCAAELIDAGLVPGADADARDAIGRGWWADGGEQARRWLGAHPSMLWLPEGRENVHLWRPWRRDRP
jgi:hypothetical protein